MRRYLVFPALCLFALGTAAADTFNFTYTGSLHSATGTLTATANGDGSFTAVSGTGLYDGDAITLIANPSGTSVRSVTIGTINYTYDDQLFPSGTSLLDGAGLLFSFTGAGPNGATAVNICGSANCTFNTTALTPYGSIPNGSPIRTDSGSFTLTNVPEPSAFSFVGLGLLGIGTLRKRLLRSSPLQ